MIRPGSLNRMLGKVCAATMLAAAALHGQSPAELAEPNPRVERVRFRGVESVSESELRESIATQPTTCRSLFLRPFCWITDSRIFEERHRLDRDELLRDELRVRVFYWLRGYRQAQVASEVNPAGDGVAVTFTVEEGPPTIVTTLRAVQTQPVLSEREIADADLPREGKPVNRIELDSAKIHLLGKLWERGYADAEVRDTVLVADSALTAAVEVTLEPGRRATIGQLEIQGNEGVSERTIRRLMDLRPGRLYRRGDVLAAQRRLYQSNLFRQALITVPEQADTAKELVVSVREAPFRAVRLGAGFNTVEFAQAEAGFTRYNWLGSARRLDLRATVGNLLAPQLYDTPLFGSAVPPEFGGEVDESYLQPTWQVSADVTQPFFLSPRNSLGLQVFAHRRTVPGIVIDRGYGLGSSFTRRLMEDVPASVLYRFEETTVEAGNDVYYCVNFGVCRPSAIGALRGSQRMSPLGLNLLVDRADDPLFPTAGFTVRLDAEHASEFTISDYRYNRASGEVTRYLSVGPGVLAGRLRAGWVDPLASTAEAVGLSGTNDAILHPRKRFYAGGARSVRGYGENQLGPRILTVAPAALTTSADTSRGTPCTTATLAAGTCDPNIARSRDFQPRPLGGNSVIEASLEYRFPFWGPLGGAVFVDGATVGDRNLNIPSGARRAITPGFGIRYRSPVGPIRVDLGIKPDIAEELPVVTSVTEDGETRIVQLETLKRYDPLEDSGGFFRQALNRLTLHLSIGEAF
jgi:outer membrane protein assembly factor BamA